MILFRLERGPGIALQAMQEKKALSSRGRGRLRGFLELRRRWGFSPEASKEQVSFNFMAAVTTCSNFGAPKNKVCHCFHCFPNYCHEVMGLDAMILVF